MGFVRIRTYTERRTGMAANYVETDLHEAWVGMKVAVEGFLDLTTVTVVELFKGNRKSDRLYGLARNEGGWSFLELALLSNKGRTKIEDVRLTRQVTDAPQIKKGAKTVEYGGMKFKNPLVGGGPSVHIGRTNRYENKGTSSWVTYTAKTGGVTYVLTYATWQGGSGVFFGQLVPKKRARAIIPEQTHRASTK